MKVDGKVVVVTGAGSGMGRELTLELARRGARIAAVDMREGTLLETKQFAEAIGATISTHLLDVSDLNAVASLPAEVSKALGDADCLINNAGIIQPFVKVNDLTLEQAKKVMDVNFYGPLALIKAFLPSLLGKQQAHILNVSSMGAYAPVPGQSVYGASKAAIKLLTEGLHSELMQTGVGVTIVFPGAIATNIAENSGMKMDVGSADSSKFKTTPAPLAAKLMVDAIENNTPRLCIGSDAKLMDKLTRLNPVFAAKLIYNQMKSLLK